MSDQPTREDVYSSRQQNLTAPVRYVSSQTTARRQVILAMTVAVVVQIAANWTKPKKGDTKLDTAKLAAGGVNIIAWLVVVGMLSIATDFQTTADLARAFAFLILITVLLTSGPEALKNINAGVTKSDKAQKAKKGSAA